MLFLIPGPSVCEKPQAVVEHRVTQHPKYDSPMVVVLVGQTLHETSFVFGTCQAFVDTNFLMEGVVMPEYPVCMVDKGLVPCTGIVVWFSRAWQSFVVDKVEEAQQVGKVMLVNPSVRFHVHATLVFKWFYLRFDVHLTSSCRLNFEGP
jgi:hypothetical protein